MHGPYHRFFLVSARDFPPEDINLSGRYARSVDVSDYLLQYISDTLRWLPTFNPAKRESMFGLAWHGVTQVHTEGAGLFEQIFRGWAKLLALGPDHLCLKGPYTQEITNNPLEDGFEKVVWGSGGYEMLTWNRDKVVAQLEELAAYGAEVVNDRGLYIMHFGI
jgi:hypothetical protein